MRLAYRSLSELHGGVEVMTVIECTGGLDQCNCLVCGYGARSPAARQVDVAWQARDGREAEEPDEEETGPRMWYRLSTGEFRDMGSDHASPLGGR